MGPVETDLSLRTRSRFGGGAGVNRIISVIASRRRYALQLSGFLVVVGIAGGGIVEHLIWLVSVGVVIAMVALHTWLGEGPEPPQLRSSQINATVLVGVGVLVASDRWFPDWQPQAYLLYMFGVVG